jgi:23S rRNA pseudouridine955/2504/2580 synthase
MIAKLYEDSEILVVDKPAGLAVQPGADVRISLVDAVERDYGFRPYLVHRLDKETAGCIIVAKDREAAAKWSREIEAKALKKVYRAVVSGSLPGESGRMDEPVQVRGEERPASTEWRLLGRFGSADGAGYSYLELRLGTGRTHQIRLHLAQAGVPILGDDQHGDFRLNKRLRKEFGLKHLLLLAYRLELPGGQTLLASIPPYLSLFLASFPDAPEAGRP